MADPLAVYGAVLATSSVGWQIKSELRRQATKIPVHLEAIRRDGELWAVTLSVVNDNDYSVLIVGVGFEELSGNFTLFDYASSPWTSFVQEIEGELPAHRAAGDLIEVHDLEAIGLEPTKPLIAFVRLDTGRRFLSNAVVS